MSKQTTPDTEHTPGQALLEMAAHLDKLETELRPGPDTDPVSVDAWLRLCEQKRRTSESLNKVDPEALDFRISTAQSEYFIEVVRRALPLWNDSLREALPKSAHPALDRWHTDRQQWDLLRDAEQTYRAERNTTDTKPKPTRTRSRPPGNPT